MQVTRLRISVVAALVVACSVVPHGMSASAVGDEPTIQTDGPTKIVGYAESKNESSNSQLPRRHSNPSRQSSSSPLPTTVIDPQVRTDPNTGQLCAWLGQKPGDPLSNDTVAKEVLAMQLVATYPVCTN